MDYYKFEWDNEKAEINFEKHGVTFEEAKSVFWDECAIEFYDSKHSEWEDRFLLLGLNTKFKLLLICHCHRENDEVIRIISARHATKNESKHYKR